MNATSISTDEVISDNAGDSDSDTNSDENLDYYQPISSINDSEDSNVDNPTSNGYYDHESHTVNQFNSLSNGHDQIVAAAAAAAAENGVRSLNLSDDDDEVERENEEEEARRRAEMDSAMWRAFQEDESRRNAPLSSDNATRVMEAMRRVSFPGSAPDWIRDVPDDNWVHQLQRLRQPPPSPA